MLSHRFKELYWKTNAVTFMGFDPGTVVVTDYRSGGGFAGAPEQIVLGLVTGIAPGQPPPEPVEFPQPSPSLAYHIGGQGYTGYHYKRD